MRAVAPQPELPKPAYMVPKEPNAPYHIQDPCIPSLRDVGLFG